MNKVLRSFQHAIPLTILCLPATVLAEDMPNCEYREYLSEVVDDARRAVGTTVETSQ